MRFFLAACCAVALLPAAQHYAATGLVLKVDRPHRSFVASCKAIPQYMDAMVMPIPVHDLKLLDNLKPGVAVDFTLIVAGSDAWAEDIRIHRFQSTEQDPFQAGGLQMIQNFGKTGPQGHEIAVGEAVPDFTLTGETGRPVSLSQFRGKIVVAAFVYTSCPLPNYCFRLSNNLGQLQKRFRARLGRDLVLLSITIDPVHDTPPVLARYALTWKADPEGWHFLTGPEADIQAVTRRFGVNYWPGEGFLTHSLHTIVIGRDGRLAANLEGNEFSAQQLGDLVSAQMDPAQNLSGPGRH
ncbi:MAG TPA: SCO family protein [Bryobacteraceae bacterium]|nr:SCO family protein [Bryobacteraceae bacterium]